MVKAPSSPRQIGQTRRGISNPRLGPYDNAAGGNHNLALELYLHNLDLSAAFYELIGIVEVVLRNALNDQLINQYGTNWFADHALFDDRTLQEFERCWMHLRPAHGVSGSSISNGKFVSRLGFGTWTNLLDTGGYRGREPARFRCDYEQLFWRTCLHRAFPNYSGTRKPIYLHSLQIQMIRNRIAHHEPILWGIRDVHSNRGKISVTKAHALILDFADFIDADVGAWLKGDVKISTLLKATPKGVTGLLTK